MPKKNLPKREVLKETNVVRVLAGGRHCHLGSERLRATLIEVLVFFSLRLFLAENTHLRGWSGEETGESDGVPTIVAHPVRVTFDLREGFNDLFVIEALSIRKSHIGRKQDIVIGRVDFILGPSEGVIFVLLLFKLKVISYTLRFTHKLVFQLGELLLG
jgi:hypothetical protein